MDSGVSRSDKQQPVCPCSLNFGHPPHASTPPLLGRPYHDPPGGRDHPIPSHLVPFIFLTNLAGKRFVRFGVQVSNNSGTDLNTGYAVMRIESRDF